MLNSEKEGFFRAELTGMPVYSTRVMHIKKENAVCITGHREKSIVPYNNDHANLDITLFAVKAMLNGYLSATFKKGYTTIISGLAEGIDLWAAKIAICQKRYENERHLIGVMPYRRHFHGFSEENRKLLQEVERYADFLVSTCDNPDMVYGKKATASTDPQIYRKRNYYMVDNCSVVIAFYNEDNPRSGTGQTIRYAKQQDKHILCFNSEDIYELIERTDGDKMAICEAMKKLDLDLPKADYSECQI